MNHCTLWFEGWWSHCCRAHDRDYLLRIGQALADERLYHCVLAASNHPVLAVAGSVIATAMFTAVSLFGSRFYPKK